MSKARYDVSGRLIDALTRQPMTDYSVITESGIRDEGSPLCLVGIKAGDARTDADGRFQVTFFTKGSATPTNIEVHIEFRPGSWRCRVVPVNPSGWNLTLGTVQNACFAQISWFPLGLFRLVLTTSDVQTSETGAICIDLGRIEVDYDLCRVPTGDE